MNKFSQFVLLVLSLVACPTPPLPSDTTPPTMTLRLEPAALTVTAPGSATLRATANETLSKVEFFDGPTKLSEDTSSPYEHALAFTAALNGTHAYTAKGFDLSGNSASSSAVSVTVNIPLAPANWYVNPTGGADANDGKTPGSAFKTICRARDAAQAGQVIALMPGVYDSLNQNKPPVNGACVVSFNKSVTVRALEPLNTTLRGITLSFQDGGAVDGLRLETDTLQNGSIESGEVSASAGTFMVNGLLVNQVGNPSAFTPGLAPTGTAQATVTPGAFGNYLSSSVPDGKAMGFAIVSGSTKLIVQGGTFDAAPVTNSDSYCSPLFSLSAPNAAVTLEGVTVRHKGTVARVSSGTFTARLGSVLEDVSTANNLNCLPAISVASVGNVTLENAVVQNGVDGIATDNGSTYRGTVSLNNATVKGFSKRGLYVSGNATTPPAITVSGSSFSGNTVGLETVGRVNLSVRGSTVQNNATDGLKLTGNADASFDLGTAVSPGGNTIDGNGLGLRLNVPSGVIANAVGNTWKPNEQQSNALGKYVPAASKTFVEFAAPAPAGGNFILQESGSKLRL